MVKLQALASKLESQLKSGNFKDRTGNLRRSIRVAVILVNECATHLISSTSMILNIRIAIGLIQD